MKVSEKTWIISGGGYRTLLLVMAVLGLFSLVGCSNASGGGGSGNGSSSTNAFVGAWENDNYGTLTFSANGSVSGTSLLPTVAGTTYRYSVTGDTATITMVTSGMSLNHATATLSGETLRYRSGSQTITFTKQTSSSTKK